MAMNPRLGQFLYGILFCAALPALLFIWASLTNDLVRVNIQGPYSQVAGWVVACLGLVLQILGMANLWHFGRGLPMNAYPPPVYVTGGVYRYLHHPIYVGFCLLCAGLSLAFGSASGLFLVTPVVIVACLALVLGYEQPALTERFDGRQSGSSTHAKGNTRYANHYPLLGPPSDSPEPATFAEKLGASVVVLAPWLVLYEILIFLGPSPVHLSTVHPIESRWPVMEWTEYFYILTYPFVIAAPFVLRTKAEVREFVEAGWWLTGWGIFLEFVLPFYAPARPFDATTIAGELLAWERSYDGPVAAFPSFHVIWALTAAKCWSQAFPRAWTVWWGLAWLMSISCVTTGNHSVIDVLAGVALFVAVMQRSRIWSFLRSWCERLANSWRAWQFGGFRVINHGLFAGMACAIGILLGGQFLQDAWVILLITICTLVGAGLWGQYVTGSPKLLRPFGYYGAILGGIVGALVAMSIERISFVQLCAVAALTAPWVQAIGRLRCLVQGCCHGKPTSLAMGIQVSNPHSRVCSVSGLDNIPIHITPLYSIITNIVTGLLLFRLWYGSAPPALLLGLYCILNGAARFVEESYRGEIQTPILGGLRLYQWLAIAGILLGVVFTCLPGPSVLVASWRLDWPLILTALTGGLIAAFFMGMDFPQSNWRFARLSG